MRLLPSAAPAVAFVLLARVAAAQPPPGEGEPETPSTKPEPAPSATTPPPPPQSPPPPSPTPEAAEPAPPSTPKPMALLAPRFPEDFYPGEPDTPGLMPGVPLDSKGLRFAMHGYFRAPLRLTRAARPGSDTANWRTPFLVDDSYFNSGFAYTPVNESDFTELYFSVGNEHLTATVQFQGSLYSDAARPIIDNQQGISQGYLTYRVAPDVIPGWKTRLRVKAGAFWDRFGYLPKYDTYAFARTHQMGEQVRLEVEKDRFIFWLLDGIGTHLEDLQSNEGLTVLHYTSAGASYDRLAEAGIYAFDSAENDIRPLSQVTDANLSVWGFDGRVDTRYAGKLYGVTSWVSGRAATFEAPVLEVMHSFGGRGLTENFWGTQSSNNGTGKMWNLGFQYDLSFDDIYREVLQEPPPLPWHGDINASLFGLYSYVNSDQSSPDPLINKNGRQYFKYGAEGGYRITDWFGASFRYDRVVLDTGDSANSFRILSPRLSFYTSFLTHEVIYLQYSRYDYNERIRLRPGQVQLEDTPDDHVFKIQAQIVF